MTEGWSPALKVIEGLEEGGLKQNMCLAVKCHSEGKWGRWRPKRREGNRDIGCSFRVPTVQVWGPVQVILLVYNSVSFFLTLENNKLKIISSLNHTWLQKWYDDLMIQLTDYFHGHPQTDFRTRHQHTSSQDDNLEWMCIWLFKKRGWGNYCSVGKKQQCGELWRWGKIKWTQACDHWLRVRERQMSRESPKLQGG